MQLREKYAPTSLDEVIGQPAVEDLKDLVSDPVPCCLMLEGPPGTGKTLTAELFAAEMGCTDFYDGLHQVTSVDLTIDYAKELFGRSLRLCPMRATSNGWKVVIIEELEACASGTVSKYLKVALDRKNLPPKTIVIATSNDSTKVDGALRQRFMWMCFDSSPDFVEACQSRLAGIWFEETGELALPTESFAWGHCSGSGLFDGERWSMRLALDEMQRCLGEWRRRERMATRCVASR